MENRRPVIDLSKQVDLKVVRISRRHLLRLLVSGGILAALAGTNQVYQNSDKLIRPEALPKR